jgi:hypothetical protein
VFEIACEARRAFSNSTELTQEAFMPGVKKIATTMVIVILTLAIINRVPALKAAIG